MKTRSHSITFRGKAARRAFEAITGTKLPPKRPDPQNLVDAFNATHPVGAPVLRHAFTDKRDTPTATKTRSEAWVMGGHSAMVMVEGFSGGQSLEAIADPGQSGEIMPGLDAE